MNKSIKFSLIVVGVYVFLMVLFLEILPALFPDLIQCSSGTFFVGSCDSNFHWFALALSVPGFFATSIPMVGKVNVMLLTPIAKLVEDRYGWTGGFAMAGFIPSLFIYFLTTFFFHKLFSSIKRKAKK